MKNLKFLLLFTIAATIFSLHAANCPAVKNSCKNDLPCCELPQGGPQNSAYNYPANTQVCCPWDVYITATFLYIQPFEEQMEFAQSYYLTPDSGISGIGKLNQFSNDWKVAFKVGFGINMDYDNWDAYFQYTRIDISQKDSLNVGTSPGELVKNLFFIQLPNPESFQEVTAKWDLNFNVIDMEVGRPFYSGKNLKYRIHYGLKGGWISDRIFSTASTATYGSTCSMKAKSWLIGPRLGIYTKWCFADNFRFFGNGAASILYQKFYEVEHREPYAANATQWYTASNYTVNKLNPALEAMLGIGWGSYFNKDKSFFDLAIAYEFQVYYNQNINVAFKDLLEERMHVKAGNLFIQGLNVNFQFDF